MNNEIIKNFFKNLKIQRYFLPLLCLTYILFINKNYNNYGLLAFITFLDSLIILSNFNYIVIINNAKPIYYEDLYIDVSRLPLIPLDNKRKKLYRKYYTRILVFSNSFLLSALVCYWKSKLDNMNSVIELVGVTGGLIEIAACFNIATGKISLYLIKKFISIQVASQENISSNDSFMQVDNYELKNREDIENCSIINN
ncbi:hypothetical protein CL656_00065 [bacterium]|nr:hypothetical protein [bacterium]|tara:strand:- start:6123 stop:6716 length:594 start_codon:yes stop_codon:yes gene_type:complete